MAPIEIKCLQCGKQMKVKAILAGKKGKCPVCGKVINIPDPSKPAETLGLSVDLGDSERKKVAMSVASTPSSYRPKKRGIFARLFGSKKKRPGQN